MLPYTQGSHFIRNTYLVSSYFLDGEMLIIACQSKIDKYRHMGTADDTSSDNKRTGMSNPLKGHDSKCLLLFFSSTLFENTS